MKKIKIFFLKRALVRAYNRYVNAQYSLSCGVNLAEHVSPRVSLYKAEVNKLLGKLRLLDSDTPDDL